TGSSSAVGPGLVQARNVATAARAVADGPDMRICRVGRASRTNGFTYERMVATIRPTTGDACVASYGSTRPGSERSPDATSKTLATQSSGEWALALTRSPAVTPS